tara:strand:+ start:1021 stop:1608 length:588 start_codon:yes stop_codon:yes gene_type:complete
MNCVKFNYSNNTNSLVNLETSLNSDIKNYRYEASMEPGIYSLQNIYSCSGVDEVNQFATNNLGFLAKDGFGVSQQQINEDSKVKYAPLTSTKNINQLFPRSIGTIPLLTKKMDLNADTFIKSPEYSDTSKSYSTVTDRNFNRFTPLIYHLKHNIQNPNHIIPENSLTYWKQGGISTRDLVKNTDYLKRLQLYRNN